MAGLAAWVFGLAEGSHESLDQNPLLSPRTGYCIESLVIIIFKNFCRFSLCSKGSENRVKQSIYLTLDSCSIQTCIKTSYCQRSYMYGTYEKVTLLMVPPRAIRVIVIWRPCSLLSSRDVFVSIYHEACADCSIAGMAINPATSVTPKATKTASITVLF